MYRSILTIAGLLLATGLQAQVPFDSGSDGSDGVLSFDSASTETVTVIFDPASFDPPLDPDGDNVYHFESINIPSNFRVVLRSDILGHRGVYWLSQGDVVIDGHLDLDGEDGFEVGAAGEGRRETVAGAGGFNGGMGSDKYGGGLGSTAGQGPGGGRAYRGAGHVRIGGQRNNGGAAYGSRFLLPLIGGSGGGGAGDNTFIPGANGAAGGGAICISGESISLEGSITANGGAARQSGQYYSGGGSGGSVRLFTKELIGSGAISTTGFQYLDRDYNSSGGRIRVETYSQTDFTGTFSTGLGLMSADIPIDIMPTVPSVRVVRIDGVDVPQNPNGTVSVPDAVIQNPDPVLVELQTTDVPTTTVMTILLGATGSSIRRTASTTPVEEDGTAEATMSIPRGFSNIWVEASW